MLVMNIAVQAPASPIVAAAIGGGVGGSIVAVCVVVGLIIFLRYETLTIQLGSELIWNCI